MTEIKELYEKKGQGHVFAFFDELSEEEQQSLLQQAADIDLDEVAGLVSSLVKKSGVSKNESIAEELAPADYVPLPDSEAGVTDLWEKARVEGEKALRSGRVAAFTVAGGQGTRLGYDGPKGTYGVSPVLKSSLFQIFAEKILAASRIYGKAIHWYLMTSIINNEETVKFFEENEYFGLHKERVHFFTQGLMPAVDEEGKILLADKANIAMSPDGHGGALRALVRSGSIRQMEADGIDTISYFQVDNPLVRCIDPEFIGFHLLRDSELSSKTVPKAYPEEKVGVFCEQNGQAVVVEYSDLPERLASELDENGEIKFRAGSIAIHVFARDFIKKLGTGSSEDAKLPFHLANKKVAHITPDGKLHEPTEPNAYKFEMFVFDSLPFAKNPVIIETARADDFSPVKNAEGVDSPKTCCEDQLRQYTRWVKAAGIDIETDDTGLPSIMFEISPLFADTEERFVEKWSALTEKPELTDGLVLV